jgi:bifunctional UDP-N-acetylglucosamine pyrophosphorylase/glucosamine-1-phosphate N-acetyltransferase
MAELLSIIVAAGEGTRMRSAIPKVLHPIGGLPIVGHVVKAAMGAGAGDIAVVIGPGHDAVREAIEKLAPKAAFFVQSERKGTAHAASMARDAFAEATGYIAVTYGDHPLLKAANFAGVIQRLDAGMDAAILGFVPKDPTNYGRFITDGERLLAIREHRDASEEERKIGLCNACILAFRAPVFRELIDKVQPNNSQGEYYLTDLVELANAAGYKVGYAVSPEEDVLGVNDRVQMANAERLFQEVRREDFMRAGVTLKDPASTFLSWDTEIGRDVTIEPNVVIGPGVKIDEGATIRAFSYLEGSASQRVHVGAGASVGPFARLRPGADLAEDAKVGNFVEVKNARVGKGAKLPHLSYIGDAEIGAKANVGAGAITCNYDGINKATTVIGDGAFIGSNASLVAPVTIGANAYVASGSVITKDVEPDALALGRARQENKAGYAPKLRARAAAIKTAKAAAKG